MPVRRKQLMHLLADLVPRNQHGYVIGAHPPPFSGLVAQLVATAQEQVDLGQ